jgi:hypothetical protein
MPVYTFQKHRIQRKLVSQSLTKERGMLCSQQLQQLQQQAATLLAPLQQHLSQANTPPMEVLALYVALHTPSTAAMLRCQPCSTSWP